MKIVDTLRIARRYYKDYFRSYKYQIKLFNCQIIDTNAYSIVDSPISSHWLYQFISKRIDLPKNKTLSIFGINGDKLAIDINRSHYKIFYTNENVHVKYSHWNLYEDLLLGNENIDLSLGFDYFDHLKYLRFPYWIMATFQPDDDYKKIREKCDCINKRKIDINKRTKFCAFICRTDYFGDRAFFADEILKIGFLNFPGKFRNNDDSLVTVYHNHKINYLQNFKFNLCPENSNNFGYVTEKIFDAISSGCIPIYWGSNNHPEAGIINQNAVIFLNLKQDNQSSLSKIKDLHTNKGYYFDFINQDRLEKDAPEKIYGYFMDLEKKINQIVLAK